MSFLGLAETSTPVDLAVPAELWDESYALTDVTSNQLRHCPYTESILKSPSQKSQNVSLPGDAVYLVKHYSTTVLKTLTLFRHSKTPWHIMFVPHAKTCLAALTLGEALDQASLCAFYGMLSISAMSLGGLCASSSWMNTAKTYKQLARGHACNMLRTAYDLPKTAKYKSILMALLTMVQVAMLSGDAEQTDCYFLETEKLIRVQGLNRKKSRRVRLLHHCYAFDRMFHESIFLADLNANHRRYVRKAIESSGAHTHSLDGLTFRMGNWCNLEQEMLNIKDKQKGENDLHIELPGIWSDTLYPEIFGVPELYVFILSLTIRLGEERDAAANSGKSDTISLKDFLSRAKAVERCIRQLRQHDQSSSDFFTEQSPDSLDIILDATYNALVIYFYRRVYDVDPALLHVRVQAVCNCLMRFDSPESDQAFGAARLIWPALIAGCEAEDTIARETILHWLNASRKYSGSSLFDNARVTMQRIWEQKEETEGRNTSWIDLIKMNV